MKINLQGNVASEAVIEIEESSRNYVFRGNAVCCNDLDTLYEVIKNIGVSGNKVIVLRKQDNMDLDSFLNKYTLISDSFNPDHVYHIISNVKLPERKNVYSIYIKTSEFNYEEQLFLIEDGDNLLLDIPKHVLYLYIADIELTHRKYELMKIYNILQK
ncbi:MAG: hypothetical protein F8N38_24580 [Hungatella sp.]|nr:hypothetical protein [Hungatella sp.]